MVGVEEQGWKGKVGQQQSSLHIELREFLLASRVHPLFARSPLVYWLGVWEC